MRKFEFLNKYLFENDIQKIKKEFLRNYLKNFFNIKTLFIKLFTIVFITIFSSVLFFLIRENMLNSSEHIVFNKGVGLGIFNNDESQTLVYSFKSILSIVFLLFFIFSNKWYISSFSFIIGLNGILNLIDKGMVDTFHGISHYDAVVDYIFIANSVSNVADVLIVISFCFLILGLIYNIYFEYKKSKEKDKLTNEIEKK